MYPFERYMKILKGYVKNQNRSEDCIVECHTYEEAVEFYCEYLSNFEAIGLSKRVCTKRVGDSGKTGLGMISVSRDLLCQAHEYVMHNTDEVQSYINEHVDYMKIINRSVNGTEIKWLLNCQLN